MSMSNARMAYILNRIIIEDKDNVLQSNQANI
ncbi:hypothetical protein HMPREF1214_01657 [Bacteroides sp. HPS0048]|jgi:hypothetical protein|nr:hypothetical protein HMPREF1214_01657 [Bacteroides sp. HPS0048]